jgi:predicted Zn-dependent protease
VSDLAATYDRATFLFETKKYAAAADLFAELVEAEPDHHELQLFLARAYYHSAQLRRAEERLRVIVERWPSDAYAHLVLGRTLQGAGRAEEGRQHLLLAQAMGLTD